mgnify:CR=1 FL=1
MQLAKVEELLRREEAHELLVHGQDAHLDDDAQRHKGEEGEDAHGGQANANEVRLGHVDCEAGLQEELNESYDVESQEEEAKLPMNPLWGPPTVPFAASTCAGRCAW